jgi:hypothetical protein
LPNLIELISSVGSPTTNNLRWIPGFESRNLRQARSKDIEPDNQFRIQSDQFQTTALLRPFRPLQPVSSKNQKPKAPIVRQWRSEICYRYIGLLPKLGPCSQYCKFSTRQDLTYRR